MFYVILGLAVFGPYSNPQLKVEFGLLALLQIRRPLRTLINGSSALADAAVAFQRISDIGLKSRETTAGATARNTRRRRRRVCAASP